jgi:uncharacterized protein YndB with AHSA1/START domain
MAARTQAFKFKRTVAAPPAEVYRAFTSPMVLREWLCDSAQADPRKGGRLYLWWNSGYYTTGEYTSLVPDKRIAFTWFGKGEPAPTAVLVSLSQNKAGTAVTLTHSGVGAGKAWQKARAEFQSGWDVLLENLQSVVESGVDLRIARRPMLGITFGEPLTPEVAGKLGVPVREGFRIDGVLEGMGAHAAGLQKNDVVVSLDGKKIDSYPALVGALQKRQAGDEVKVVFYRDGIRKTVAMELSARPLPQVPDTAAGLAEAVQDIYTQDMADLRRCLEGVTETEASAQPAPGEWSAKEVLAHLIAAERDTVLWISTLVGGAEADSEFFNNLPVRVQAVTAVYRTLPALLEQLEKARAETVAAIAALPEDFVAHKGSHWRLGYSQLNSSSHIRDHVNQVQAAIEAARKD